MTLDNSNIYNDYVRLSDKKAAIGYVYEDSTPLPSSHSKDDDDAKKDSDSDIDLGNYIFENLVLELIF